MKYTLIITLILITLKLSAQNLVANGDFEDINICTEYQKECAPEAWIATSLYWDYYFDYTKKGIAGAASGTHFVGLTAGSINRPGTRNFIRTRLLCGLHASHQYKLSFYTRANFDILDSIGIYFSAEDYLGIRSYFKRINPQLWSHDVIKQPLNPGQWHRLEFTYTANGTEGYMTIGNFKRDEYNGISKGDIRYEYLFLIDSVALTPMSPAEKICVEADSVRKEIYLENYRHNYLERKIFYMRKRDPEIIPLPKTIDPTVNPPKIVHIDTLVIPDIFFASGSARLTPASFPMLDSFANMLSTFNIDSMVVEGHTDSIGKLALNEVLSLNRANAVREYVAARVSGLESKSTIRGWAFLKPIASNKTPKGRQQNRRVEIFVYRRE